MGNARAAAITAVVVAALLWGTTGTVASFRADAVSPLAVGAATMGVGGALLFLTAATAALRVLRDPGIRRWLVVGAVGVFVYPLAFYTGMDLAGVAIGNVVALGAGPIVTAVCERVVERHPLSVRWMLAVGLAIGGMCVLVVGAAEKPTAVPAIASGIAFGLGAGLAYGLYTYAAARVVAAGHSPRGAMGAIFGAGALALIPVLIVTGRPVLESPATLGQLAYLAVGPMFVAYLLIGFALRSLRSSTVTTIALLEPVAATALAVVVVGERLTPVGWAGLAAIVAGILVLVMPRFPHSGGERP